MLCDLNSDCPDNSDENRHCGACDFEHSKCGFVGSFGLTSWKRTSGSTWAAGTGPTSDHTKGTPNGKVLFNSFDDLVSVRCWQMNSSAYL